MPGELLTAAPLTALFGKLPAHGDFVRRGDPALAQRLDAWLSAGIAQLAGTEEMLDERLAALPTWCFRLTDGFAGAMVASRDKVGRIHPLIACSDAAVLPERVAAAIELVRDEAGTADALQAMLGAIVDDLLTGQADDDRIGWWQVGEAPDPSVSTQELPIGANFVRLFGGEQASCPA